MEMDPPPVGVVQNNPNPSDTAGGGPGHAATDGIHPDKLAARQEPYTRPNPMSRWIALKRSVQPASYNERVQLHNALQFVVSNSNSPSAVLVEETSLGLGSKYSWLSHLFSAETLDKLFASDHMGNFVIVRATGEKIFETMPIYARIGMHLLFYGPLQIRLLRWRRLRKLLKSESIRQGEIYDSTDPKIVRPHITSFIVTYDIDVSQLLQPDLNSYRTFNEFFSRKLRPDARPPASPGDASIIVSAADCRLIVWPTWDASRKLWVKGRHFNLSTLVRDAGLVKELGPNPALAIFRLAPQDYHRFHAPVAGTIARVAHIPGEYYTVNPQAVNERFDVLTANTRSVATLHAELASAPGAEHRTVTVAVVAVGALLVGSIRWDKKEGERVGKGDGFGYFQYGGSTVICVFPQGTMWDADLLKTSADGLETLVKAGERIGQAGKL